MVKTLTHTRDKCKVQNNPWQKNIGREDYNAKEKNTENDKKRE